jgi:hypothetical protein
VYSIIWRHHLQLIVNVDRFPEFIQEIGSEAVDIGFAVWSQAGGLFSGDHMPLPNELVHDFALIMDVHEDQDVGDQMAILNDFSLFITGVRRNDALAAKGNKLNISVSLKIDDIIFIRSHSRITLTAINLDI